MSKFRKAGILGIAIVIPVLIYLFLVIFGKNHYALRTFYPIGVNTVEKNGKKINDTTFYVIPNFGFVNQNGSSVSQSGLNGDIYVADFFFTRCGSICPKMTSQLTRVQEFFIQVPEVKILSFTVDPDYDSVKVLNNYAKQYKADSSKWFFLTGSKDSLYSVAKNYFKLSALEDKTGEEEFIHSERLVLVDRERHIRGYYDGTNPADVDKLMLEIDILLYTYGLKK